MRRVSEFRFAASATIHGHALKRAGLYMPLAAGAAHSMHDVRSTQDAAGYLYIYIYIAMGQLHARVLEKMTEGVSRTELCFVGSESAKILLITSDFAFQSSMVRHHILQHLERRNAQLRRQKNVVGIERS